MSAAYGSACYREEVEKWLKDKNFEFNIAANCFESDGATFDNRELAAEIHLECDRAETRLNLLKVETTLRLITDERRRLEVDAINAVFEDAKVDRRHAPLREFLAHLMPTDTTAEDREDALAALRHWMWLVKRQLSEREQRHHLMLIFYGPQGGGKSSMVRRLLEPLGTAWAKDDFSVFNDQFGNIRAHYAYALFLDEMGYVSKSDSAVLKDCVSSRWVRGRRMHSDAVRRRRRNATFIAATNWPPPHGLQDESGARRFYSIACRYGDLSGARGEYLASFDPQELWGCVSAHEVAPMAERIESIARYQEEQLRVRGPLEAMLEATLVPVDDPKAHVSIVSIHERLCEYMRIHNLKGAVPYKQALPGLLKAAGYRVVSTDNRHRIPAVRWQRENENDLTPAGAKRRGAHLVCVAGSGGEGV